METHNTLDDMKGRLEKLEQKDNDLEAEKRNLLSNLDAEFQKHHGMLGVVVTQARDEFAQVKANLQDLYGHTSEAFQGFRARVEKLEATAGKGGGYSGAKTTAPADNGYLPVKSFLPKAFDGKEEGKWRKFCGDVSDFLETENPGMKTFLKRVEMSEEPITDDWISSNAHHVSSLVSQDHKAVYRCLKHLTDGEARLIVESVPEDQGFQAWKALHSRYGLSVAAK